MHNGILSSLKKDPHLALARFASGKDDSINIVGAYGDSAPYPVWFGKTSSLERGMGRLRMERDALAHLAPWAQALNLPSLLFFEDTGKEVCLIQSGVAGFPSDFHVGVGNALPVPAIQSLEWLERFQDQVTPPQMLTVSGVVDRMIEGLHSGRLQSEAIRGLAAFLQSERPGGQVKLTATHGDYWRGNVLFGPAGIGVIDWDELRTSFALEDVFTYVLSCVPYNHRTPATPIEAFQYTFFSESPGAQFLGSKARAMGLSESVVRFCFYGFVANRLVWKEFSKDWLDLLHWLYEQKFPAPVHFP